ncbi:MAG: hypothetical protein ACREHG_10440, partial [Candidatus Saccharimonadales bacterium]
GRNNEWVINREGVTLRVYVMPSSKKDDEASINISMNVPKNRVVKPQFGSLRIYGPSGEELHGDFYGVASGIAVGLGVYRFDENTNLLSGSRFAMKYSPSTVYDFGVTLKENLPSSLDVVLPLMEINGHEYPPLTIHFTKKTGTYYVVTINC